MISNSGLGGGRGFSFARRHQSDVSRKGQRRNSNLGTRLTVGVAVAQVAVEAWLAA